MHGVFTVLQEPKLVRNLFGTCSGFVRVWLFFAFFAVFAAGFGRNLFGFRSGKVWVSCGSLFFSIPGPVDFQMSFFLAPGITFISFSPGNLYFYSILFLCISFLLFLADFKLEASDV